jgi:CRP-like cAMP-binding protein
MTENLITEFQSKFPAAANELGPDNLQRLLSVCVETVLPADRRLFRDKMPVDSAYLVLEGELVATIDNNGHTIEVGRIGPGAWLGEVAVLSGNRTASSNVNTVTPCRLLKLRAQDFEDLAMHDEEISSVLLGHLIELMASRLHSSNAAGKVVEENN